MRYQNNPNTGLGGFLFGVIAGAALAYFYSQNKETVDAKVKTTVDQTLKGAEDTVNQAAGKTSEVLSKSGNRISDLGTKIAASISQKAAEIDEKAQDLASQAKPRGRRVKHDDDTDE